MMEFARTRHVAVSEDAGSDEVAQGLVLPKQVEADQGHRLMTFPA